MYSDTAMVSFKIKTNEKMKKKLQRRKFSIT